jgi:hypothetical protein
VQPTTHQGQFCYSFTVWDQSGKIALTVGYATREEAVQAAEQVKAVLSKAVLIVGPR